MFATNRVRATGKRLLGGGLAADLWLWLTISVSVFLTNELPVQDQSTGVLPPWVQIFAVPLLGAAVAVSRRQPVLAAAVPAGLALAATQELYTTNLTIAQIVLAFLLGRRSAGMRTGLLLAGGVCVAGLALAVLSPAGDLWGWFGLVGGALLTILLPCLAGRYVRQRHELVHTAWELAERTRLVERSRIAGDMHDSLGHELSLIALRAAVLQVRPGLDQTARTAAGELREAAAAATERLREIIGILREDTETAPVLPVGDTIAALIERAAGSGVTMRLHGELPPLPPMADRAAYRVVQEALTNTTKHAPGAAVTVTMGRHAAQAVITVTNEAPPTAPLPRTGSGGHGLVSLDERVRLAGGRLKAGPVDGGFTVTAYLPLTANAATATPDSQRQFAQARNNMRRSVFEAIWVPAAAAAALAIMMVYYSHQSVLDANVYERLRIGQSQSSVEQRLPMHQADDKRPPGAPADPPDTDECRFYRTTAFTIDLSSAYRLCFTKDKLSHKDKVAITPP